jgi:hypothetical protein
VTEWEARFRCGGGAEGGEVGEREVGREEPEWREGPGRAGRGIWSESIERCGRGRRRKSKESRVVVVSCAYVTRLHTVLVPQ